jgi:hypothetical protein
MADTVQFPSAELGLDEAPVEIVSTSRGRADAVLHTLLAWQAPGYMIALALAFAEGGWNPFPSYLCGVHLHLVEGNGLLTSIYAFRVLPDGRRRLL